jgi:hypothetical protein
LLRVALNGLFFDISDPYTQPGYLAQRARADVGLRVDFGIHKVFQLEVWHKTTRGIN